jgi:phytol kinase
MERLQARTLPFTRRNLAIALGMWLLVSISLPTSATALMGPYRVVSVVFDSLGFGDAIEWAAFVVITLIIILVTGTLAIGVTRIVITTSLKHVRYGLPIALALMGSFTLMLIINPTYMIWGLDMKATSYRNFTFGSFPSEARLDRLGEQGYTIVSLVHPSVLPFEARLLEIERGWAEDEGIEFISIPMMPWASQNAESIEKLKDLALNGAGKYYVHCWFGYHRTMDARTLIIETIEPGSLEAAPPADYGPTDLDLRFPDVRLLVLLGPAVAMFMLALAWVVIHLRTGRGMRPWATRKVVHVAIFSAAAVVQLAFGFPGVLLYGAIVGAVLAYSAWRGHGFDFYDAVARQASGTPRRKGLVLVPFMATGLGGLTVNLLFYPFAAVGYLVNAFGDAAGEIVGRRFGKRKYDVPLPFGMTARRTIEGSLGVFAVAMLAALLGFALTSRVIDVPTFAALLFVAVTVGVVTAVVEAVSGGGLDNFTIQVAAAGVVFFFFA